MALGEQLLRRVFRRPENYQRKVWCLAAIYLTLNATAVCLMALVVWRGRLLITLAQRSNVETLVLLIVLVLAFYYLVTTMRGAVGAMRMISYNLPALWGRPAGAIERRKQDALAPPTESLSACVDKLVRLRDAADLAVKWELEDEAGSLGTLIIEGATATFRPSKQGVNNSLFEFLVEQIHCAVGGDDPAVSIQVVFWVNIDDEGAAVYRSTVTAFENLARHLQAEPLWPCLYLTRSQHAAVGEALRAIVPALRNEALLPDLEYEVEYSVPILPEPLAFVQLRRQERRADPVLTMGYALLIMLMMLAITALLIMYPPWVPSV